MGAVFERAARLPHRTTRTGRVTHWRLGLVLVHPQPVHPGDDDAVVVGDVLGLDRARHPGDRAAQSWTGPRLGPRDTGEPVDTLKENCLHNCPWPLPRTLTQNVRLCRRSVRVDGVSPAQNITSGGCNDTETKELHAIPTGCTNQFVAEVTVTPAGRCPRVRRKSFRSNGENIINSSTSHTSRSILTGSDPGIGASHQAHQPNLAPWRIRRAHRRYISGLDPESP
jgi:hypothetical protein